MMILTRMHHLQAVDSISGYFPFHNGRLDRHHSNGVFLIRWPATRSNLSKKYVPVCTCHWNRQLSPVPTPKMLGYELRNRRGQLLPCRPVTWGVLDACYARGCPKGPKAAWFRITYLAVRGTHITSCGIDHERNVIDFVSHTWQIIQFESFLVHIIRYSFCLLYTSPSPRD